MEQQMNSDLKFLSMAEGRRYAELAGFTVEDKTASREDMPGVKFDLVDTNDGKCVWRRSQTPTSK